MGDKMKKYLVTGKEIEQLHISEFGFAESKSDTFWGSGYRNQYIVHYVLSGKGYFNGYPVKKGQGFIIEPLSNAEYHYDNAEPWKYFWFITTGALAQSICKNHIFSDKNGIFDFEFIPKITGIVNNYFENNAPDIKIISEEEALSLFFMIMSFHRSNYSPPKNNYVEKAKRYIELNFHRQIKIKEIAEHLNIADRYLYNLFIMTEGVSPKQYLNNIRLEFAKKLLLNTASSITDIAESVGYSDVLSFSKFFSEHINISPSQFRKNNK